METMSDVAEDIRRKVAEHGYASLSSVTFSGFNELADRLGSVIESADISPTGDYQSLLSSPARMPFHTDGPEAAIVGWWCQRSAYPHGVSLLIDTKAIAGELTAEHLIELTRTPIRHPIAHGRFDIAPCLTRTRDTYRIYYSPWHLTEPYPAAQRAALDALQSFLHGREPIMIALRRGACLFIDNGRMLHARTAFPASSGRLLRRVWIGR